MRTKIQSSFSFCSTVAVFVSSFVQGLYWWCIQGHTDIKGFKLAATKSWSFGVGKSHPEAKQRANKCLTVWGKKWDVNLVISGIE